MTTQMWVLICAVIGAAWWVVSAVGGVGDAICRQIQLAREEAEKRSVGSFPDYKVLNHELLTELLKRARLHWRSRKELEEDALNRQHGYTPPDDL